MVAPVQFGRDICCSYAVMLLSVSSGNATYWWCESTFVVKKPEQYPLQPPAVSLCHVMFVAYCIWSKHIQSCAENTEFSNVLLAEGDYQCGVVCQRSDNNW